MRSNNCEDLSKNQVGRGAADRKEVALRKNRSGLNADGSQRWSLVARFNSESYKKASDTGYVMPSIDRDQNRLYFLPVSQERGYKLTGIKFKSATISVRNIEFWEKYLGDYNLLKDVDENLYYIDLREGKKK